MKTRSPHVFIFAGEKSGDLHGSHLIGALKQQNPLINLAGVAGEKMRAQGITCFLQTESFEVMGFTDVLRAFPRLYGYFCSLRDHLLAIQPCVLVLIDYPGFTLRLAKALRKKGYRGKIVHYIAPSIWAHGQARIQYLAATVDLLLTIYPFEAAYFSASSLKVEYVGNPLSNYIENYVYKSNWREILAIPLNTQLIALFPGSRRAEIERHLPLLLEEIRRFRREFPNACFALSFSTSSDESYLQAEIKKRHLSSVYLVPPAYTYELMRECHVAIAKSGTVTLELALHAKPTLVIYHVSLVNWLVVKLILRVQLPFYCIVNILQKAAVFPELIEEGVSGDSMHFYLKELYLEHSPLRLHCLAECKKLRESLKGYAAAERAATKITELLHE